MRLPTLKRFVMDYLLCLFEAGLMLVAWGDVRGFLSNGARAGMIIVLLIIPLVTIWGQSERVNRGVRPTPGQWRTLAFLELGFFISYWVAPYFDRHNILVLPESNVLRYTGLLLFVSGVTIRTWAFIYLGRFFSIFLTIQKGHRLVTDNIYKYVRHPSYTGLLVRSMGAALVFRSIFGMFAWLALLIFLLVRIRREEKVLTAEFGAEWDEYKRRTRARLVPRVY
ncbi:MAG TPA: isoprenylcysteine carboxylmethyltransferase family protein [Pyrinomonadaceae bacterium]